MGKLIDCLPCRWLVLHLGTSFDNPSSILRKYSTIDGSLQQDGEASYVSHFFMSLIPLPYPVCSWLCFHSKPKVKQQYLASLSRVASATPCWVWSLCKSVSKLDSGVCYVKCRLFEAWDYLIPLWPLWWFNSSQVLCRKWTTMLINNRYRAKTSDSHDAFYWVSGDLHKNQEASTIKLYQSASSWDFKASSRQVSWIIAFSPLVKLPDHPRSMNARLLLWSLGGGLWGPGEKEQSFNDGVARRFHSVAGSSVPGLVRTHRVALANSRSGFPSGSDVGTVVAAFAQGFNVSVTKRNSWRRCLGLPVFTSWDARKRCVMNHAFFDVDGECFSEA